MITKNDLKIIEGGIRPKEECKKAFISAYITDTRLMGAMGMCIRWEVLNCKECDDLIQFFYFDTEEYGLESYYGIWGYDRTRALHIEHTTMGCLGGKKVALTEKEACCLVKHYHNMNVDRKIELPKGLAEYKFILEMDAELADEEMKALISKICTPIVSDNQLVNYFMMRNFGKDILGVSYLCNDDFHGEKNLFPEFSCSTMFRNSITKKADYYICESLINENENYYICTSKIWTSGLKVTAAEKVNAFHISYQEAAMILGRTEYVSVYNIIDDEAEADAALELSFNTTCSFHCNGRLLMVFKENNDHVDSNIFVLNNDIYGTYFITPIGQFVLTAYTLENIQLLESKLLEGSLGHLLVPAGKFAFQDGVTGEFIGSEFYDFIDFMDAMDLS